jgi:hypothetical protein
VSKQSPALGSIGRATPDVRAAAVRPVVHPRPSPQSLLGSSSPMRLAQAQTGRSRLALARRREDLTVLQQQIRAVRARGEIMSVRYGVSGCGLRVG